MTSSRLVRPVRHGRGTLELQQRQSCHDIGGLTFDEEGHCTAFRLAP